MELKQRIQEMQQALSKGLVERDESVRLVLLAALAGEHLFLVGPPGTAKSELARRIHWAFEGKYFERLLTRFSVPEELFGPLSIKKLEEDCYERLTKGYLPRASIAFIDEIFKANSAILNSLLTLLNERKFDNGTKRLNTRLVCVVAASNELPESEELDALYDRFLLRYQMSPVSSEGFTQLINLHAEKDPDEKNTNKLSKNDLEDIQREAQKISVADGVKSLLRDMREFLQKEKIQVSDRRWRKIVGMLKVAAYTNGKKEVSVWDCWILQHCLWNKPDERKRIFKHYQEMSRTGREYNSAELTSLVSSLEVILCKYVNLQVLKGAEDKLEYSLQYPYTNFSFLDTDFFSDEFRDVLYKDENLTTKKTLYAKRDGMQLYCLPFDTTYHETDLGQREITYTKGPLSADYDPPDYPDPTNDDKGYTKEDLEDEGILNEQDQLIITVKDSGLNLHRSADDVGQYYIKYEEKCFNWKDLEKACRIVLIPVNMIDPADLKAHLKNTDELIVNIGRYKSEIENDIKSLSHDLSDHLWVDSEFAQPASTNLQNSLEKLEKVLSRAEKVRKGFEKLPIEGQEDDSG